MLYEDKVADKATTYQIIQVKRATQLSCCLLSRLGSSVSNQFIIVGKFTAFVAVNGPSNLQIAVFS